MTRIFLDGIQPSAMPASYPGLAGVIGYTDGNWPDYQALVARYPGILHVSCTVTASVIGAVILDVENGDASPAEAPGWVSRSRLAGVKYPVVYCNYSTWPLVQAQFVIQKVAPPLYGIAKYDDVEEIPNGAIYKQYKNTAGYDVNVVADHWPGVDPVSVTPKAPAATTQEDEMSTTSVNGRAGLSWAQGSRHVVQVTYDPAHGDPTLRVVLILTTGPVVLTLAPSKGSGVLEIPVQHVPACRGAVLTLAAGSLGVVFDAFAA